MQTLGKKPIGYRNIRKRFGLEGIELKETKERIMEEALALFAENGYLGTSMSDIASRLGITKGALYKHYAGKKEILNRIVERM